MLFKKKYSARSSDFSGATTPQRSQAHAKTQILMQPAGTEPAADASAFVLALSLRQEERRRTGATTDTNK